MGWFTYSSDATNADKLKDAEDAYYKFIDGRSMSSLSPSEKKTERELWKKVRGYQ